MSLYVYSGKMDTFKYLCYKKSKEEVILRTTTDNKLAFDSHMKKMRKKSGQN